MERVRNAGEPGYNAINDKRKLLYKEYATVLKQLQPVVAVLENVKGILSAQHEGKTIFPLVMDSLRHAGEKDQYRLFALSPDNESHPWIVRVSSQILSSIWNGSLMKQEAIDFLTW